LPITDTISLLSVADLYFAAIVKSAFIVLDREIIDLAPPISGFMVPLALVYEEIVRIKGYSRNIEKILYFNENVA
jgi:hypothetical protein